MGQGEKPDEKGAYDVQTVPPRELESPEEVHDALPAVFPGSTSAPRGWGQINNRAGIAVWYRWDVQWAILSWFRGILPTSILSYKSDAEQPPRYEISLERWRLKKREFNGVQLQCTGYLAILMESIRDCIYGTALTIRFVKQRAERRGEKTTT